MSSSLLITHFQIYLMAPLHTELKVDDPSLIREGEFLDIFYVNRMISVGGFGQVFDAVEGCSGENVALKVESLSASIQLLASEAHCLRSLNRAHNPQEKSSFEPFIRYFGYGVVGNVRYMAMEKCGMNVRDLKKTTEFDRFSIGTSMWILYKMIDAMKTMHTLGWLHRDVKPANFCVGAHDGRSLFVLDFGMSRCFVAPNGKIKPRKPHCSFHGTLRYVSLNIHHRQDASTWDDLWSVYYVAIENMVGQLPWRNIPDKVLVSFGSMKILTEFLLVAEYKASAKLAELEYGQETHQPHCLSILSHYLTAALQKAEEYFYCPPPYQLILSEVETDLSRRNLSLQNIILDWQHSTKKETKNSAYIGDYMYHQKTTPKKKERIEAVGDCCPEPRIHHQNYAPRGNRSVYFY
ncbi:unnamed protein product [Caenorhabditis auriculariae]|uniref:Protein kinase domain-containing protein n=1 Tax=Caenorhabditis auriculariae TaxID=2777116 RepID=A0A8S1GXM8_9PELO|nr:unnamed protein product [Caenorhabditis auriculariae]